VQLAWDRVLAGAVLRMDRKELVDSAQPRVENLEWDRRVASGGNWSLY
jgi:hypothetical protein